MGGLGEGSRRHTLLRVQQIFSGAGWSYDKVGVVPCLAKQQPRVLARRGDAGHRCGSVCVTYECGESLCFPCSIMVTKGPYPMPVFCEIVFAPAQTMVQLGEPSQLFATPSRADGDSFIVTRTAGFRSGSPGLLGVLHQGRQWSGAFSTPASRCRPLLPAPGPVSPCGRPATRGAHSPPLISWLTRAHH